MLLNLIKKENMHLCKELGFSRNEENTIFLIVMLRAKLDTVTNLT